MIIQSIKRPDFRDFVGLKQFEREFSRSYRDKVFGFEEVAVEEYRSTMSKGVFLMPISIVWRKSVVGQSIDDCLFLSEERKKVFKIAFNQSQKKGIKVELENPLSENSFLRFKAFYDDYMKLMNYQGLLSDDYFYSTKTQRAAINLIAADGTYLGGRLLSVFEQKITADFRAVKRENVIKEGYDTLCEKAFYEFAALEGRQYVTLGSELNLRGIGERKLGLVLNKTKYGYSPYVLNFTPRMYVDLNFLQESDFEMIFFVSLDNSVSLANRKQEKLQINFVLGKAQVLEGECLEVVKKVSTKLVNSKINVFDINFNNLNWNNDSM